MNINGQNISAGFKKALSGFGTVLLAFTCFIFVLGILIVLVKLISG